MRSVKGELAKKKIKVIGEHRPVQKDSGFCLFVIILTGSLYFGRTDHRPRYLSLVDRKEIDILISYH